MDDDSSIKEMVLVNSLIGRGCSVTGKSGQVIVADYDEIKI